MHAITYKAHRTKAIHTLSRVDRNWRIHNAWLVLKSVNIQRFDGERGKDVSAGDVLTVDHGYDRDTFVTHTPINTFVGGYLLSGKWEPMIGLFLPLFDKKTIISAIEIRLAQSVRDAMEFAKDAARDCRWC